MAAPDREQIVSWLRTSPPECISAEQGTALADLIEAEADAPPVPEDEDLCTTIERVMSRSIKMAEKEGEELRALHAQILRIPLDQLDAHLAEEERKERERKAEIKAAQPARTKAKKVVRTNEDGAPERVLSERQLELLRLLQVEGNVAVYTGTERIADWDVLKDAMSLLGAKWNKKGFAFGKKVDASKAIQDALSAGALIDTRAAGFFPTPADLADALVADLELGPHPRVMEPSAGHGALAEAVLRRWPDAEITCVELLAENVEVLREKGFNVIHGTFEDVEISAFDVVIMNPPFANDLDIKHVRRALQFLKPGGQLAAIVAGMSPNQLEAEMLANSGKYQMNPEGSFKEAGTLVRTAMVWMTKPTVENAQDVDEDDGLGDFLASLPD